MHGAELALDRPTQTNLTIRWQNEHSEQLLQWLQGYPLDAVSVHVVLSHLPSPALTRRVQSSLLLLGCRVTRRLDITN
jgi:hypothetical protein